MSVQRAVLGELVGQSDYSYSIALRLDASSASVYQATERLLSLGYVELVRVEGQRNYYRATEAGVAAHWDAAAREIAERRKMILGRLRLANVEQISAVLDECESSLIAEMRPRQAAGGEDWASRLAALEQKTTYEALLAFIEGVRQLALNHADV